MSEVLFVNGPYKNQWRDVPSHLIDGDSFEIPRVAQPVVSSPYEVGFMVDRYTLFDQGTAFYGFNVRLRFAVLASGDYHERGQAIADALYQRDVVARGGERRR